MINIKLMAIGMLASIAVLAQEAPPPAQQTLSEKVHERFSKEGLKVYLSPDSSKWLKATVVMQAQARYDWNNTGTTVGGYAQSETADAGLRRLRFQLYGYVSKHVFVYTQFGLNNFNYLAPRKQNAFFHDAVAEYKVWENKKYLSLGAGLTSMGGPLRYSAPAVGSILMADAPIYQQTTADQNDQFGRKLGVYIKGQIGKFDYRIGVSKPFAMQTMVPVLGVPSSSLPFDTAYATNAKFSPRPPELQYQAYFKYHFFDTDNYDLPYNTGTYLGKKRMLTLGAGIQYQQNAVRYWDSSAASIPTLVVATTGTAVAAYNKELNKYMVYHDLLIIGVDLFYDSYINKEKGNAISAYGAFSYADYGQNYLRYNGVMNMATGNNGTTSTNNAPVNNKNSYGNAFPMMGTGNTKFVQVAYKFKNDLLKKCGTIQPYLGVQVAQYQALQYNSMVVADIGVNWLVSGYNKISLNYQSRPVYQYTPSTNEYLGSGSGRTGLLYLQYQIAF
ncbi:MAG TPA: hypothetical protein VF411_12065 [Bacteroidia bacterium]